MAKTSYTSPTILVLAAHGNPGTGPVVSGDFHAKEFILDEEDFEDTEQPLWEAW